jgi:hypothetical protein
MNGELDSAGAPRGAEAPPVKVALRSTPPDTMRVIELGCLARSALGARRRERHAWICALARLAVESIQWGIAPASASTGVMGRHGKSTERGGRE